MTKAVNDATGQKAGDIFQYLVALRDCFELQEGDTLQIEVNGDVSILTGTAGKFQKEIKHHFGKTSLNERNIDFWKTLANWYDDFDRIKVFSSLILYCTSEIKTSSPLYNWNKLSKEDKLGKLESIGSLSKKREEGFRKQYIRIFHQGYDKDKLLEILGKFSIESARKNIVGISEEFSKYIGHIPDTNRDSFIGALLGRILILVKDPPHKWEVTRAAFEKMLQAESAAHIDAQKRSLPTEFSQSEVPIEQENELQDKRFVKAIHDIAYTQMVHDAISDYWKMDMTVFQYFHNDILYLSSIDAYKDSLSKKLFYAKEQKKLDAIGKKQAEQILISQKLYLCAMEWDAADFGSIIDNQYFFQHGVIHDLVDDGGFEWKIGGEDEHQSN